MIKNKANKLIEGFYGLLPYQTAHHIANAQKEFLRAIGSIIDEQIKWTDVHVDRAHPNHGKGATPSPSGFTEGLTS
jgi:hypothetical protein